MIRIITYRVIVRHGSDGMYSAYLMSMLLKLIHNQGLDFSSYPGIGHDHLINILVQHKKLGVILYLSSRVSCTTRIYIYIWGKINMPVIIVPEKLEICVK